MLKIATQSPRYAEMVKLPNGTTITRALAIKSDYTIAKDEADAASIRATAGQLSGAGTAYLDALLALPEGKDRPLAASRIAARHDAKSMPLAKAALFLSGLPIEAAMPEDMPLETYAPAMDALIKRRAELHLYTLDKRAIRGDREAKADAVAIRYGLEVHRSSRMQCVPAFKAAGVHLGRFHEQTKHLGGQ